MVAPKPGEVASRFRMSAGAHPGADIHPAAIVADDVQVGLGVSVGPFAVVEAGAVLGAGVQVGAHAIVHGECELGDDCVVDSFAVIGGAPQMRGWKPAAGRVRIGARTVLREGVTVNRPTAAGGVTVIGSDCMLMANSHVGHDSQVGDRVTLANNVMLAGHVQIGDGTFVGGGAGVHQFVRIGGGAMIGGNASISYDVPPFAIAAERNDICGLNLVGIRRQGIPAEAVRDLKQCYHAIYSRPGDLRQRAAQVLAEGGCGSGAQGRQFLEFFTAGRRGFARTRSARGGDGATE